MAIFEIEQPDGTVIEIDAPDQATAVQQFQAYQQRQEPTATPEAATLPPAGGVAPDQQAAPPFDVQSEVAQREQKSGLLGDLTTGVQAGIPFSDEILAGMSAPVRSLVGAFKGEPVGLGEAYNQELAINRELLKRAQERSPVASTVGSAAGGVALGGTLARGGLTFLRGAQPTAASLIGRSAAEGAAYGAAYGAGAGEDARGRLTGALAGAGSGALIGGATGGLSAGVGRVSKALMNRRQPSTPTAEEIKAVARTAYDTAENAGVVFKPAAGQRVLANAQTKLAELGYHPTLQPRIQQLLNVLDEQAGSNVTLKGVQQWRRIAGAAAQSQDASERTMANAIIGEIDDLIANPQATEVLLGDSKAGAAAFKEATGLWKRAKKTELIESAILKAEDRAASAGTGGNLENATRQNIRRLLDNERTKRLFSKGEQDAMREFVRGTTKENMLRLVGRLSPETGGLQIGVGSGLAGAGFATGNPLLALIPAIGFGARRAGMAARAGQQAGLQRLIATGQPPAKQALGPTRQALTEALTRGAVAGQR